MKQLLWTRCLSVWVHAGSCFIQKRSSCSSPTSLAFDCTIFARLTTKRMAMKRRIKSSKMMEKPRGRQMNHPQQMWAERKVCIAVTAFIQPPPLLLFVCFDLCVFSEPSTPLCCGEVRRWSHGGYTLLHDGEAARAEYALDLVLPFGCAGEFTPRRRTNCRTPMWLYWTFNSLS